MHFDALLNRHVTLFRNAGNQPDSVNFGRSFLFRYLQKRYIYPIDDTYGYSRVAQISGWIELWFEMKRHRTGSTYAGRYSATVRELIRIARSYNMSARQSVVITTRGILQHTT